VHFESVSWLPVAAQHRSARPAALGVPPHVTRRCGAAPADRPDAGRHCSLPAELPSTAAPAPSTGVPGRLIVCRTARSATEMHPARPKSHAMYIRLNKTDITSS